MQAQPRFDDAGVFPTQAATAGGEFIAGGAGELYIRSWRPTGAVRAVVGIVPGFSSHSGHYTWLATQLCAMDLAVYAVDLRGRGKSSGTRFHVERFDDYLDDVQSMLSLARTREPGVPVFLLGHSAGGVIASAYALAHQSELAGLVCESFALELPAPGAVLALVRWLSGIAPQLRVLALPNKQFSRDAAVVAQLDADPLIAGEKQTAMAVTQMLAGRERLKQNFANFRLPVLILHGTADAVTLPKGSRQFHAEAGSPDNTLHLYEGHYHDLFSDLEREVPMADVRDWLEAHIPA